MKPKFENDVIGLYGKNTCSVCNSPTYIIRRTMSTIDKKTSWENESTMKLFGLDNVESQIRFCFKCFHAFRYPLYDESMIYGERGFKFRKETFEKYNPGQEYGGRNYYQYSWFIQNKRILEYLTCYFDHIIRKCSESEKKESLKILDYGGGDGYHGETISLISNKVIGVPCKAYCYDYHEWDRNSNSPYFHYITSRDLVKESPYDIVMISNVLEHTSFPVEVLKELFGYLHKDSIIIVAVPYEHITVFSPVSAMMNYHQQLFSTTSLYEAMRRCNYKNIYINVYDTYYRGNSRINNIVATANIGETLQKRKYRYYLIDIYKLQNILAKELFNRIIKRSNI